MKLILMILKVIKIWTLIFKELSKKSLNLENGSLRLSVSRDLTIFSECLESLVRESIQFRIQTHIKKKSRILKEKKEEELEKLLPGKIVLDDLTLIPV